MRGRAEFDAFYDATSRRVLHQMYAMTGNLADARECTQEAYGRAWRRWSAVSQTASPEAWVRTTAWLAAAGRWRPTTWRVRRREEPEPGSSQSDLIAVLRQLPAAQRRVVVLRYLAGLDVDEIALETGTPVGTVEARLAGAKAALAPVIADDTVPAGGRRE
ncbi:RNA polymerase sigma factor [Jiangella asiatica]|uniref:Sigma-70 family RNA polymerase sigma factor n=1 Tax=Jiangella asiatica TaxID=2530372 RepID=A0A4R5CMN9_9ACTN|nr:sigma-70 family RNA polymerase sigma factor [Jiangella asiatica]TDD99970.1 sigma-70 family RNA polymerase sigma factor [Jiangella asiatica]